MTNAQYHARLRIVFRHAMDLVDNEDRIKRAVLVNYIGSTKKRKLVSVFDLSEFETDVVELATEILNEVNATKGNVFDWAIGKRS